MKKQENKEKRPKSFRAIAVRIIALALCMWLGFAGLLTWTVSEDIFRQLKTDLRYRVDGHNLDLRSTYPGHVESEMIHNLSQGGYSIEFSPSLPFVLPLLPESKELEYVWAYRAWTETYDSDCDRSVIYFDIYGEPLMTTGNRMIFEYINEEKWQEEKKAAVTPPKFDGMAWIDLDAIDGAVEVLKPYVKDSWDIFYEFMPVIRLTGWFEGNEFHPVTMERGWSETRKHVAWYREWNENKELDKNGLLNWETVLTAPAEPGQELVTIYGGGPEAVYYDSKPVTVDGTNYESLTAWRLANDYGSQGENYFVARGLFDTIISCTAWCYNEYSGPFYYTETVRFNPLERAMQQLQRVYWVSGILTVLAVALILVQIWQRLIWPLRDLNESLGENLDIRPWGQWEEAYALENWCKDNRQALLEAQADISRLNTALDYARDAEEYRKQLISNITHELKTPLAVVHSYTEGLQSEIAPEKKERYMQVILDEAERMDGMVMQMLELSRLEAGRVKLKMEYFDLGAVIRDVAERFEPLMAEKELKLRLELGGQEQMNGDEGRMEQVITNFMSNAVKYSTPGGEILVKAILGKLGLSFSITNNAKHLSEEGLQKVYDSFYREDAARTEKSTGLGLAIVKNIMNLHGFRCYVNNTTLNNQPAVEFGFRRE